MIINLLKLLIMLNKYKINHKVILNLIILILMYYYIIIKLLIILRFIKSGMYYIIN